MAGYGDGVVTIGEYLMPTFIVICSISIEAHDFSYIPNGVVFLYLHVLTFFTQPR